MQQQDRHRTVAALIDGGPGTAIYRSDNGGESWSVLKVVYPITLIQMMME